MTLGLDVEEQMWRRNGVGGGVDVQYSVCLSGGRVVVSWCIKRKRLQLTLGGHGYVCLYVVVAFLSTKENVVVQNI